MGPDKISKGVKLVPEVVMGKVPGTGGWVAGSGMMDVDCPPSPIRTTVLPEASLGSTNLGGSVIDDWGARRTAAIIAPRGHSTTSDTTYGYFWGKDSGNEATARLNETGKGFEAWYSNGMHITRPDTGLPLVIQTATGRRLFHKTNATTMEPKTLAGEPADEEKKHLFGVDHWFMGAKHPNQDTMSPAVRETYFPSE